MPCFHPLEGFRSSVINKSGKRSIVFDRTKALADGLCKVTVPCGQCSGCRLERSRQWAMRIMHEASLHEYTKGGRGNVFITLTFNDDAMEKRGHRSLDVRDWQLFMKRLRKKFGNGIRFYHCGEYGEQYGRPHYHAILFNCSFDDRYIWRRNNGNYLYCSPTLEELWPHGYSSIGDVTFKSAAYVARYVMKKRTGKDSDKYYSNLSDAFDPDTGEVFKLKPEYNTMSRRPGIANDWYLANKDEVFPDDFVVVNGSKCKPPKYYDSLLERYAPGEFELVKEKRKEIGKKFAHDNTPDRLQAKEICLNAKISRLVRKILN